MQFPLDLDRQIIAFSPGGTALLATAVSKRGSRSLIAIPVVQDGVQVQAEITDLELRYVAKDPGEYDQTPRMATSDFAWNASTKQYEAYVDWRTAYLNSEFGVQLAAVTLSSGDETTEVITASGPHGLAVNERIWFPTLTGGTGIIAAEGQYYYVKTVPSSTTFTISATEGGTTLNFTTAISAGSVRYDPVDVASVSLINYIGWRLDSGDDWTEAENSVEHTLQNNGIRDDDGAVADIADSVALSWGLDHFVSHSDAQALSQASRIRALDNSQFIASALTGGAAGALDSIVTAGGTVTAGRVVMAVVSGVFSVWQLQAGTTAEDAAAGVVRPDDYAATTNEFIWTQVA